MIEWVNPSTMLRNGGRRFADEFAVLEYEIGHRPVGKGARLYRPLVTDRHVRMARVAGEARGEPVDGRFAALEDLHEGAAVENQQAANSIERIIDPCR
jgi:hypothetical protein